ncbi:MAG TPA: nitroreductase family protein [Spirochaetota bacterium]|nr:nitroreductase family protein [Spirochaetota bacterium]
MAVPTTRTKETGRIIINEKLCNGCGLCVSVCKDFSLIIENGKAVISDTPVFGCIGCGHCMAICPRGAITVSGRCISPEDMIKLPDKKSAADYSSLLSLLNRRRSIREFKEQTVKREIIEKVLEAAQTAPMGLPPSDVHALVFDSREKVRGFAEDFCRYLEGMKWLVSGWFLALMRPFWGKENDELFRGFLKPCINIYTESMKKGINLVNYDAPAAIYFYGSPYSDPADPIIAATYAMLAAESLGLGTCMLGAIHPMIQNGGAAKKFREKHGIKHKSREGLFLIMGYPSVKYSKGIKRTFASVDWHE